MKWARIPRKDGQMGKLCVAGGEVKITRLTGKEGYKMYLTSDHWKAVKQKTRKLLGSTCLSCGADKIDHHHLTYKNRGNEKPGDVIPLCRSCHYKAHTGELKLKL